MGRVRMSKSHMFLIEFVCVVLFFALCSAVCIKTFAGAEMLSKKGKDINDALLVAQTVAETIKASDADNQKQLLEEAEAIASECQYDVVIKSEVKEDMFSAKILVSNEEELCELEVKKYIPSGETL